MTETVDPQVIIDPASGDAIAMWARADRPLFSGPLRAARYSVTSGAWIDAVDVSAPGLPVRDVSMGVDPAGNVFAIWLRWNGVNDIVQAARSTAGTNTWNPPVDLSAPGQDALGPRLAVDSLGNAVAVWSRFDGTNWVVQSSRYVASADLWSAASDVSIDGGASGPELVMDSGGDATAAWSTDDGNSRVQVRRYLGASQSWGLIVNLSTTGDEASIPRLAIDAGGNVFAVWRQQSSTASGWSAPFLQASRFSEAADTWGATVTLSPPGADDPDFELVADAKGNAVVVWKQQVGAPFPTALKAVRYVVATDEWGGPIAVNEDNVGLHRTAVDTEGNILVVWVPSSSVNALRAARFVADEDAWTPAGTIPASTGSTYVRVGFDGLNNAMVVWRWSQADSAPGLKSTQWLATQPPRDLFATSIAGNLVTIHWTVPPNSTAPTGYVLEGGLNPGEVLASIPTNSAVPTFTFVAPTGAFYIRVRAVTDSSRSAPSNEIRIFVNVPVVPSAPANLLGLVNGTDLALSWTNTLAGGAPTSLWLTVDGSIATALPLPMGEAFSYTNVPSGTYRLNVLAANASGVSAPSNEVTLSFPSVCAGVPAAPTNLQTSKVGHTVFLSWSPPASGPAVTGYRVAVTGAYVGVFETSGRTLSASAAAGRYTVNVMALNPCGVGPPGSEQTVVIP